MFRDHLIPLNGGWEVCEQPLAVKAADFRKVLRCRSWIPAAVPGDVRADLLAVGRISEPSEGLNCYDSEWIEKRAWWYRTGFTVPAKLKKADRLDLFCDKLDIRADIILNGTHLGFHPTAFRPFIRDVKKLLKFGKERNTLLIRLSTGNKDLTRAEQAAADRIRPERGNPEHRYDSSSAVLRKPTYAFGWDWTARIPTCGIGGEVRIIPRPRIYVDNVYVHPRLTGPNLAHLDITIDLCNCSHFEDKVVAVDTCVIFGRSRIVQKIKNCILIAGINTVRLEVEIEQPMLWWPNGHGDQNLYAIEVKVSEDDEVFDCRQTRFGIKQVKLHQPAINDRERMFAFEVNGRVIFSKGGNWVPADPLPARIPPAHYEKLISEAAQANFNMLRIWGGGLYEPDLFYELCDRYGIMIWHDFMFACSAYPEDDDFRHEIEREAVWQIRRLRNHPCIVLWCGNNENNWATLLWNRWDKDIWGGPLYAEVLPAAVERCDPKTPYWTSSPFGGPSPNSPDAGDRHCWDWAMHKDGPQRVIPEKFDEQTTKFASEYGHIGPPVKKTILQYLGHRKHFDISSKVFQAHVNLFGRNPDTTIEGIHSFYRDRDKLTTDDYVFYGGLAQGMLYGYSLESFRYRREVCRGALFWMYNDCWGEVGWTIIDYYARRKISWYFAKRAFKPLRVIMRAQGSRVTIRLVNDLPRRVKGKLEFGFTAWDGKVNDLKRITVHVNANTHTDAAAVSFQPKKRRSGIWFARFTEEEGPEQDTAVFRSGNFRDLEAPAACPRIVRTKAGSAGTEVTITTDRYAHAVHFTGSDEIIAADNYFDMLPGETRTVLVTNPPPQMNVKAVNT